MMPNNIRDPVVNVGAAETGLYKFNGASEGIEAPMKTESRLMRPVLASGKASAAKAMKYTNLSRPSGAGCGWSSGYSIATVRVEGKR